MKTILIFLLLSSFCWAGDLEQRISDLEREMETIRMENTWTIQPWDYPQPEIPERKLIFLDTDMGRDSDSNRTGLYHYNKHGGKDYIDPTFSD